MWASPLEASTMVYATDEALGGKNGVGGVGDGLAFGGLADEAFAAFREGDD